MQKDFHYYATYCAAYIAGYSHEESLEIAYSAQFVDDCSQTLLKEINAPLSAATTQLQLELMDIKINPISLQNITRIWASFHFLPYDLYATLPKKRNRLYMSKYRLICKPNSDLMVETVNLSKDKSLEAIGIAMHVLADTWAHSYFAGTPSLVINNTNFQFYEMTPDGDKPIVFLHKLGHDDVENSKFTASLYQENENSIMNLGHGRAGHLPDYSFMKYKYLPAWGDYNEIIKDNPGDYQKAFGQMVYAMKYLRGEYETLNKECYAEDIVSPYKEDIECILNKRQLDDSMDWKAFGKKLSGFEIEDYDENKYKKEYMEALADDKKNTFIGKFILSALSQKSMVTNRIFKSNNLLAGFSIDFDNKRFRGIKEYKAIIGYLKGDKTGEH